MPATTEPPEVAFTSDQIADARRLGKALRAMAAAPPGRRDPALVRDFEARGFEASPFQVTLYCDALDGVLAGRNDADLRAELVRKIEAGPEPITFEGMPEDILDLDKEPEMDESAERETAEREARRRHVQDWVRSQDGRPAEEPVAFTGGPATAAPPAAHGRLQIPGFDPMAMPREPDRLADVTPEGLAALRRYVGDDWVQRRAAGELAELPPYALFGVVTRYGDPPAFDATGSERFARPRAVLRAIVEERWDLDPDGIDREVGREMIVAWWSLGLGLAELAASAGRAAVRYAEQLARHRGPDGLGHLDLARCCARALDFDGRRSRFEAGAVAIVAAVEALPAALALRVGPIVEGIGGAEKLVVMLRESAVESRVFPGPDPELDRLKAGLDEAAGLMRDLNPPDDEEPGALYEAARARRDEKLAAFEGRKAAVAKAAMDAIRNGVAEVLAGNPANVGRVTATARRVPKAFPDGLADQLDRAALEAVLEAGPFGFACAL